MVRRPSNFRCEAQFLKRTRHSGRQSIAAWSCINDHIGIGPLYRVVGPMDQTQYNQMLDGYVLDALDHDLAGYDYVFVQDGHRTHTAHLNLDYLADRLGPNRFLTLPPSSPDLNIIENLWSILKMRLQEFSPYFDSQRLWTDFRDEYYRLQSDRDIAYNLVNSYRNKLQEVIDNEGGYTSYLVK